MYSFFEKKRGGNLMCVYDILFLFIFPWTFLHRTFLVLLPRPCTLICQSWSVRICVCTCAWFVFSLSWRIARRSTWAKSAKRRECRKRKRTSWLCRWRYPSYSATKIWIREVVEQTAGILSLRFLSSADRVPYLSDLPKAKGMQWNCSAKRFPNRMPQWNIPEQGTLEGRKAAARQRILSTEEQRE